MQMLNDHLQPFDVFFTRHNVRFSNAPLAFLHTRSHSRGASNCGVHFAQLVICEIETDRSLKVFKLAAESISQPRQAAAVHPQSVVLLFDVACADKFYIGHAVNDRLFSFHNFSGAIPACGFLTEICD